jgi:WD40 repeat protein
MVSGHRDKGLVGECFQYHWGTNKDEQDTKVRLWDANTDDLLQQLSGHSDDVNNVVLSSDGKSLASSGVDGSVIVWEVDEE